MFSSPDTFLKQGGSSLTEKRENLQYDLAFAKANLAGDEVEVKNSIARLKEMDYLLHASKASNTVPVSKLRQERNVLTDKINQYRADSDVAQVKLQKVLASGSAAKIAEAKQLSIEQQDDKLLADVLARKALRVKAELRYTKP